jgi:NAD(P)-dependent dehydrogenase (short-subunit alcohol dehydrogenase family)
MIREAPLADQSALVLGAGGAIGTAVIRLLLRDGAAVTAVDRSADNLTALATAMARQLGPDFPLTTVVADAMDEAAVQVAAADAGRRSALRIAIAIVGGAPVGLGGGPLTLTPVASFEQVIRYNLRPAFLLLQSAAGQMAEGIGGSLVFISSVAAVLPAPLMGSYSIGKAGLDALVRVAADELGSSGIRVNAVRPGFTRTQATAAAFENGAYASAYLDQQALKRAGDPLDVAELVRFLAGPESGWITGQCINVDGGLSLHRIPKRAAGQPPWHIPPAWARFLG